MPPAGSLSMVEQIAIGEQGGISRFVRLHVDLKAREHVGTVERKRDMAEAFRLALRAEAAAGNVEALECGVVFWTDDGVDLELEGRGQRRLDDEALGLLLIVLWRERLTVK